MHTAANNINYIVFFFIETYIIQRYYQINTVKISPYSFNKKAKIIGVIKVFQNIHKGGERIYINKVCFNPNQLFNQ